MGLQSQPLDSWPSRRGFLFAPNRLLPRTVLGINLGRAARGRPARIARLSSRARAAHELIPCRHVSAVAYGSARIRRLLHCRPARGPSVERAEEAARQTGPKVLPQAVQATPPEALAARARSLQRRCAAHWGLHPQPPGHCIAPPPGPPSHTVLSQGSTSRRPASTQRCNA